MLALVLNYLLVKSKIIKMCKYYVESLQEETVGSVWYLRLSTQLLSFLSNSRIDILLIDISTPTTTGNIYSVVPHGVSDYQDHTTLQRSLLSSLEDGN